MTITVQTSATDTANLTTYTFASQAIGTAAETRVVFICVGARAASGDDVTIDAVTVGGVAAVEAAQLPSGNTFGDNVAGIFAAVVPTGTTADVVVTFSRQQVRTGIVVYTSYDAKPEAIRTVTTDSEAPTLALSRESGGTIAVLAASQDAAWTGATEDSSNQIESILYVESATVTDDSFGHSAVTVSNSVPITIAATFEPQRLPAIRPHQKTRLHLRDSAHLDFGPERQTLTNNGVTVADDVFTFDESLASTISVDHSEFTTYTTRTYSCWFRIATSGALAEGNRILFNAGGMYFGFSPSEVLQFWSGVSWTSTTGTATVGQWHHVAFVIQFDGTATKRREIYLDGAEVYNDTGSHFGVINSSQTLYIGSRGDVTTAGNDSFFDGDMADVRVNADALTAGEVFDLYNEGRNWVLQRRVDQVMSIDPSTYAGSGDLLDRSGNGNDLTLPSGYTVTDGVIVSDGTADGPATSVNMQTTAGTVAFWIKTTDAIFMLGYSGATEFFGASQSTHITSPDSGLTNVTYYVDGVAGSYTRSTLLAALNDGNWHHVAVTADFNSSWGNLSLLQYSGQSNFRLTGEIDKLFVSNTTKYTAEQIAQIYALGREENTGDDAFDLPERRQLPDTRLHLLDGLTDAGFYGQEVTVNEEVTYANNVLSFDGQTAINTSLVVPHTESLSGYGNELSFAFWLRPTAWGHSGISGGYGRVLSKGSSGAEFEFTTSNGAGAPAAGFRVAIGGTQSDFANKLELNRWNHIAVSAVGDQTSVYIDGVLDSTVTLSAPSSGTSDLGIGNRIEGAGANGRPYVGDLADFRFSHNALTAGEVANLYRKGIPALRGSEVLRIDPARYSGSGDLIDQTGGGNDAELQGTATVTDGVLVTDGSVNTYARTSAANLGLEKGTIVARMRLGVSGDDTEGTSFLWDCVGTRISLFRNSASRNELRMYVDGRYRDFDPHEWDADTTYTVAMVYEKATDTLQLYWDGVAIAGEAAQGTWGSTALGTYFTIGAAFDGTGNLTAEYDWLNVYDEVLTADQIAYLSAKGNADPFPVPFGNLGGETLSIQPSRYTGSGDLLDQSGNQSATALTSDVTVSNGVIAYDGTGTGLTVPADMSAGAGSVSMWVKTTETQTNLLYNSNVRFALALASGSETTSTGVTNPVVYVDGETITDERQVLRDAINDGTWHHVAMTGDFPSAWTATGIGRFSTLESWKFQGELDDIRFEAGRKWSAAEIKLLASARGVELPNTRDAKLAVLPSYDDASNGGTSLFDYSGNLNTGTISGGPTWNTSDNSESGTRSIESTGAGSVSFDDSGLPLGDSARSIVTWVRVDDYSNDTQWFEYGTDATGQRFGIGVRNTDWMVVAINGAAVGTQNTPAAGTWAPVILTYAGNGAAIGTVTFYIDGVAYSASTQAGTGSNVPGTVSGAGALLASIVSGNIEAALDDVLVYDRVLTPGEIARFSERRNIFGDAYVAPPVSSGTWKIDTLLFT